MLKLCPICDNKVEGVWCKSCHRFVKPVEIKSNLHLNEPHDKRNDKDCEYHNPSQAAPVNSEEVKQRIHERMAANSKANSGKTDSGIRIGSLNIKLVPADSDTASSVHSRPGIKTILVERVHQNGASDNNSHQNDYNIGRIIFKSTFRILLFFYIIIILVCNLIELAVSFFS